MSARATLLENIWRIRRELATDGPPQVRAEGDFERASIPDGDADVLRDLLLAEDARTVIEVGLAYGSSALAIAEALVSPGNEGATHVIIDAFQDQFNDTGWNAIVAAGLTGVCSLLRERSQFAPARLTAEGFVADAAFVDGSTSFTTPVDDPHRRRRKRSWPCFSLLAANRQGVRVRLHGALDACVAPRRDERRCGRRVTEIVVHDDGVGLEEPDQIFDGRPGGSGQEE